MNKVLKSLVLCFGIGTLPQAAFASVYVSINIAPPPLPIYVQPAPPADDFLWIPGYWAYDDEGYFWVPGTWVRAPQRGYLWTPGYWAWGDGLYYWRQGYWGPYVGYYGGIDYGFGYYGSGYYGGRWDHDHFYYNSTVNNVNTTNIHNTYTETVVEHQAPAKRTSYNGGQGGTVARPTEHDREGERERERFVRPTAEQARHEQGARKHRELRASENNGNPPVAATPRPGTFTDRGAPPAREREDRPRREQQERERAPPARREPAPPRRESQKPDPADQRPADQRPADQRPADQGPDQRRGRGRDERDAPAKGKKGKDGG